MKTKVWILIGLVAFAAALVYVLGGGLSRGVAVEAAQAKVGRIREFVDEQAKTRLPETYLITMPITGRIEPITLVEGMPVKKNQVVAQIVPSDLELAVKETTAAVQRLEASIRENADTTVEETGYQQTLQFVKSMAASVQAAAERVVSGKAKLDFAAIDLGRVQRLASTGARTQDELDRANLHKVQSDVDYKQDQLVHAAVIAMAAATDLLPTMVRQYINRKGLTVDVLKKQKIEAEVRLQEALRDRKRGQMLSPVDGVVLDRRISDERHLTAGTPLLEIGRLEDLEVEADVLTLDAVAARVGDPVEIYGPAIGLRPAKGVVTRIYPAGFTKVSSLGVEQQRVKVIVRFAADDLKRLLSERRLGVGYRVRVRVFTADKSEALLVPRSALFRAADNSWQLFVIRNGAARLQTVEIGLIGDEQVEILKGVSAGEAVVLAPESSLTDGARVDVVRSETP